MYLQLCYQVIKLYITNIKTFCKTGMPDKNSNIPSVTVMTINCNKSTTVFSVFNVFHINGRPIDNAIICDVKAKTKSKIPSFKQGYWGSIRILRNSNPILIQ